MLDSQLLMQLDGLQTKYVKALDRKDMAGWLSCFGREGGYICTSRENHEGNLPLAIMMDDCPERLRDRVKFITEVWTGTFEDYDMRHFVQRLDVREAGPGVIEMESNFLVIHVNAEGRSEVLACGAYVDVVTIEHGEARFRSKSAILDDVATSRYLVYPI